MPKMSADDAEAIFAEEAAKQKTRGNGNGHDLMPRFQLKRFDEIMLSTTAAYLIKGILPRRGIAVIWGARKSGKSFNAFDMAMHIALGRMYRGHRVQQGPVAYFGLEGGGGFPNRAEAWRRRHLAEDHDGIIPFYLLHNTPVDLIADHPALIAAIRAQMSEPPVVVFIDTLARALHGNENAPEDMGLRAADAISAAFECLVVIVHHSGLASDRMRGHTSLAGAHDVEISITKDASGLITIAPDYLRDGPTPEPFACRLEQVPLGVDDEGDPVNSCVVVPADSAGTLIKSAGSKLTANQRRFLDILAEATIDAPASPNELNGDCGVPGGVNAVTRDTLKRYCLAKGWLEEIESNRSRAKVSDMINALAGKHELGATQKFVWRAR
jgi:hypothetical protein